jgi:dihydrofolate synthase / folylpolyglutamate synthase
MRADGGAASSDYRAAIAALAARTTHGVRLGLDRTRALLAACGDPHLRLRTFHIAGTNGKGSTCATLEAVLRASGYTVGRYSSPHLIDFSERILVNGAAVSHVDVLAWLDRHAAHIETLGVTFFEATTAMAFDLLHRAHVDVAVIETGLGGRLDSTNVVQPLVASVTSIGLDHREYLGDTLTAIAIEKAGIFKPGVPAVIGEHDDSVIDVLAAAARRVGASDVIVAKRVLPLQSVRVTAAGTEISLADAGEPLEMTSSLVGAHQAQNVATAVATLRAAGAPWSPLPAVLRAGVSATALAGRFQRQGKWIFDVAHNPDGMQTVARSLAAVAPKRPLAAVICVLADKDWRAILDVLLPVVDRVWLTNAPTAPQSRKWVLDDAVVHARTVMRSSDAVVSAPVFDEALRASHSWAESVLVTGSFHTVGDAMERLQIDPLAG